MRRTLLTIILAMIAVSILGQSRREERVDLRRLSYMPLAITIRSITPLTNAPANVTVTSSASTTFHVPGGWATAFMEVAFENTGEKSFRFPTSYDAKLQFKRGNTERRSMACSVLLFDATGATTRLWGSDTYMSSNDPNSFVELPPKETLVLTIEVHFASLWDPEEIWKKYVRAGTVEAGIECHQREIAEPYKGKEGVNPVGPYLEGIYIPQGSSGPVPSTNRVRLSMP